MSDIYGSNNTNGFASVYLSTDAGETSIDRANKLLAGFGHDAARAIGSAVKRAAQSAEAHAARAIRDEYIVSSAVFKKYTKSKRRFITQVDSTTVDLEFRGYHIPLIKFDTRLGKDGKVSTRVKRSSARTTLNRAFAQTVGHGHTGIFERLTDFRLPIEEKLGPSTPQMMASNEDVEQAVADKFQEVFEQRIEHEITAILNGWRKDGKER